MQGFLRVMAACPGLRLGDARANARELVSAAERGHALGASVLLTPRMSLVGATLGDLTRMRGLLHAAQSALDGFVARTAGLSILSVVGLPIAWEGGIVECCAVAQSGRLLGLVPMDSDVTGTWRGVPVARKLRFCAEDARMCVTPRPDPGLPAAEVWLIPDARQTRAGSRARVERELCALSAGRLVLYANAAGESTTDGVYLPHAAAIEDGACIARGEDRLVTDLDLDTAALPMQEDAQGIPFRARPVTGALMRALPAEPYMPEPGEARDAFCAELQALQAAALAQRMSFVGAQRLHIAVSGGLDSTMALLCCVRAMDRLGRDRREIIAVTMPGFGTTDRTRTNAETLMERLGVTSRFIDIRAACLQHFRDMGFSENEHDVAFENAQARERTQVLMDLANRENGLMVGTGNLSELALGYTTYNGDHMSMYSVNCGIPKTVLRAMARYAAETVEEDVGRVLRAILETPISPELLPGSAGQQTEKIVGPYKLHDYALYRLLRYGETLERIAFRMERAFPEMPPEEVRHWLGVFSRRFVSQQFKRSCMPDGPDVMGLSLSPRAGLRMPSDALIGVLGDLP